MDDFTLILMKDLAEMFTSGEILDELCNKEMYREVLYDCRIFSAFIFFWLGCNIGSFLNVCIYRLPLGMSLCHPKSHCPKCGHKISWYENIPIFSYIFLRAACKECKQRISPRYIIVEFITGLLFAAIYLKVIFCDLPIVTLLLFFYLASVLLSAAFTDCDLRVIPNKLTYPAMIVIPLYFLLHKGIFQLDWQNFALCLMNMAGTALVMSAFTYGGKKLFKRDVFGWGDVKYLIVTAGALGWFATLLILFFASVTAMIYMPVYWIFRPKRKKRGFPFAPFMTVYAIVWLLGNQFIISIIKKILN